MNRIRLCPVGLCLAALLLLPGCEEPKLGPHGWPVDAAGKEVTPKWAHPQTIFIECWTPKPNKTVGVKGRICNVELRWTCETLASLIKRLGDTTAKQWGANSHAKFMAGKPQGSWSGDRPDYPAGFDTGGDRGVPTIGLRPENAPGVVRVETKDPDGLGCELFFDEQGANYLLMWLEEAYSSCCL